MNIPETVTYTVSKTVQIADVDGIAIREGSVIREITDGSRGVVTRLVRLGDATIFGGYFGGSVGDLIIRIAPGSHRVTNRYDKWQHIPHDEQTYDERLLSWQYEKYDHCEYRGVSEDTALAIDGIMNLLPSDIVDWDYGPTPDSLDDALQFLVQHLKSITNI